MSKVASKKTRTKRTKTPVVTANGLHLAPRSEREAADLVWGGMTVQERRRAMRATTAQEMRDLSSEVFSTVPASSPPSHEARSVAERNSNRERLRAELAAMYAENENTTGCPREAGVDVIAAKRTKDTDEPLFDPTSRLSEGCDYKKALIVPCITCGRVMPLVLANLGSVVLRGQPVPYVQCTPCGRATSDLLHGILRVNDDGPKAKAKRERVWQRHNTAFRRTVNRHWKTRILPVAAALLFNVTSADKRPVRRKPVKP